MQEENTTDFKEELISTYLGRYKNRFQRVVVSQDVFYYSLDPTLIVTSYDKIVKLLEYIEIERNDPNYGLFDFYQIELLQIALEDPAGLNQMEEAIARKLLIGPY